MESFFNSLKNEHVFHEDYATRGLFDYIEAFYIRPIHHSVLAYQSQAQHYADWLLREKLAARALRAQPKNTTKLSALLQ